MADNHDASAAGGANAYDFKLYRYTPSLAAAIASILVFAVLTGIHIWRMMRSRAWYFTAFTIGGACKLPPFFPHGIARTFKRS